MYAYLCTYIYMCMYIFKSPKFPIYLCCYYAKVFAGESCDNIVSFIFYLIIVGSV